MTSASPYKNAAWVSGGSTAAWRGHALANLKIDVTSSATALAVSPCMPETNTMTMLPKEAAGQKIDYIVLDDTTPSTQFKDAYGGAYGVGSVSTTGGKWTLSGN